MALPGRRAAAIQDGPPIDKESTMKLYYSQGACSLSPHIALLEAGADFEAVAVGRDKRTADGRDFRDINPYGYVPALELDDGEVLLEGPAIVQYIADRWPAAGQAPPNGTLERYRLQSALGFINSELHKTIGSLFAAGLSEEARAATIEKIDTRLKQLSVQMQGRDWIANDRYSVADGYLFVVLRWLAFFQVDIKRWPLLAAHQERMAARPAVQAALRAEHLA
jgi:glutathione S-transferase